MAKQTYNQEPPVKPTAEGMKNNRDVSDSVSPLTFPYTGEEDRLKDYAYYEKLFLGKHFDAFTIKIDNPAYGEVYNKLRYVMANFAGLVSKVCADMLFSEGVSITAEDGDQEFIDALIRENKLDVQLYESALSNSYMGDAVFKIRVGKRYPNSEKGKPTIIIEDISPAVYFPFIDQFNVRQDPEKKELAWTFKKADKTYLRKEIHSNGKIENKVYEMKDNKIMQEVGLEILGIAGLQPVQETKIEESLIVHVPNWKTGRRYWGLSDYYDLESLFYAINNRMTKIDNILDLHSDPILAVPEGILDEKGQVKKEKLGMIEIPAGVGNEGKPEYIVWNASLEVAFKEIEKIIEMFFMVSETSPDILGMGQGQSDSGRALKLKLLRTIAKVTRKRLYYDHAIKEVLFTAQKLAKAWGVEVGGKTLKGEPVYPDIEWSDGLPIDISEQIDNEVKAIDAGITKKADAIKRVYGYEDEVAEKVAKEIADEKAIAMPKMNTGNPFSKKPEAPVMEKPLDKAKE